MASAGVLNNIPDIGGESDRGREGGSGTPDRLTKGVNDDDGGNIRDTHKRDHLYYYYSMYDFHPLNIGRGIHTLGHIPLSPSVRPSDRSAATAISLYRSSDKGKWTNGEWTERRTTAARHLNSITQ